MTTTQTLYNQGQAYVINFLRHNPDTALDFETLKPLVTQWLKAQQYLVVKPDWNALRDLIIHGVVGFGPLEVWLKDPTITEIMVNRYDQIYLEKNGKLEAAKQQFASNQQLLQVINRVVAPLGKRIDESQPLVDARLPDGSRINAIIPPLSLKGPALTIRKFPTKPFTMHDLKSYQTVNEPQYFDFWGHWGG